MRFQILATLIAASLPLAGCGGGSIFDPPVTAQMPNVADESGYAYANGLFYTTDNGFPIRLGDVSSNTQRRGLLRFDLSSIPAGAEIEDAELRIGQYSITSGPYSTLGDVTVDHVSMGVHFDGPDFAGGTLASNIGILSTNTALEEKSLNVKQRVINDLNAGRSTSDFRLRFQLVTDSDNVMDEAEFNNAFDIGGNGQIPRLIVRYRP
ncbi:MAG: hypothetical protein H6806_01875 [Planctomycetes bacterium]|nr:hypothetical protein [Planctomycetota bacterium]MCB9824267.1 hypothetical protein [Planctomycetota bacterium]MCB9828498.1 hypothetical protein [Planctomycetota bacterium]MCB9900265.1 hypothetical protein [Planctomycetota bacterium]